MLIKSIHPLKLSSNRCRWNLEARRLRWFSKTQTSQLRSWLLRSPSQRVSLRANSRSCSSPVADITLLVSGQVCAAASRVYVHESVADEFKKQMVETFKSLKLGDPLDMDTYMGPLVRESLSVDHLECA
jgi:aldehyde dehydrogenase (NAD+)